MLKLERDLEILGQLFHLLSDNLDPDRLSDLPEAEQQARAQMHFKAAAPFPVLRAFLMPFESLDKLAPHMGLVFTFKTYV